MQSPWSLITALKAHFFARGEQINTGGLDIVVGSGLVDGVDVSTLSSDFGTLSSDFGTLETAYNAHVANANAHHAQQHSLDGSDHTGTLSWAKVSKTGSSLADLATRAHSELTGLTTGDPHSQYFLKTAFSDAPGAASAPLKTGSGGELTLGGDFEVNNNGGTKSLIIDASAQRVGVNVQGSLGETLDVNGSAQFNGDGRFFGGVQVGQLSGTPADGCILMKSRSTPSGTANFATLFYDGTNLKVRLGTAAAVTIA